MIHIRCIIEIAGFPKEHIEKTMNDIIEMLKKEENFQFIKADVEEVKENNKMFSTFAEVELKLNNLSGLIHLSYHYMPSSIEILAPDEFETKMGEMNDFFNDLIERIHRNDMAMKNLFAENHLLKKRLSGASNAKQ